MKKKGTERRVHTAEFKAEAVALARKREKPVSRVVAEDRWVKFVLNRRPSCG